MILGLLQARMSSTRLPGKVLEPILGKPMLLRQLERIARARTIDRLVVATSDCSSDDPIEALCAAHGVACARGSLDDVLDRFYRAAAGLNPDFIVRLTADCPLTDPDVIDGVVGFGTKGNYDYATNALKPSFPDGLDVEVFTFKAMELAWREAELPSHREHVTPYIYRHPELFRIGHYTGSPDLSHLRWTVDMPVDLALVRQIYEALYTAKPDFRKADILALIETRPELRTLNSAYPRNEGLVKSLEQDAAYLHNKGRGKEETGGE